MLETVFILPIILCTLRKINAFIESWRNILRYKFTQYGLKSFLLGSLKNTVRRYHSRIFSKECWNTLSSLQKKEFLNRILLPSEKKKVILCRQEKDAAGPFPHDVNKGHTVVFCEWDGRNTWQEIICFHTGHLASETPSLAKGSTLCSMLSPSLAWREMTRSQV